MPQNVVVTGSKLVSISCAVSAALLFLFPFLNALSLTGFKTTKYIYFGLKIT